MFSPFFWSDLIANLLADLLIAIIFGLFLSQYFQKRETKDEIERRRIEAEGEQRKRRREILQLLKSEVEDNIETAEDLIIALAKGKGVPLPGLTTEIWDAFTQSGQLTWLSQDLPLFRKLARGYRSVKAIILFESQFLEASVSFRGPNRAVELHALAEVLTVGYQDFVRSAKKFLAEESKLTKIKTEKIREKAKK